MNPETLAIARENLISIGKDPTPDAVAQEAKRIYEANKQDRRPKCVS